MKNTLLLIIVILFTVACKTDKKISQEPDLKQSQDSLKTPFVWESANLYFLLIDRFKNGDLTNDNPLDRNKSAGVLRSFEGGDLKGVIQKIEDGYFTDLGINAIWMTPVVEQIHGSVDEGTGNSYGFHGYWTKDWTAIDPNYGTKKDLKELVEKAHAKGIRIVLDAVINHTGPVTDKDPVFPKTWVRTGPQCTYDNYDNYINCTLVENLPDIKTESNESVELPKPLADKWKKEGRYEEEMAELDAFFKETGYPRAPKYYIMKWLSDYIADYGIDGYRVDTVKHTYEDVWIEFSKVCDEKFKAYKTNHPEKVLDNNDFFLVGEVYNYGINTKRLFDFGDKKVDYFATGFNSLINFDFKGDANGTFEDMFTKYSKILNSDLKGFTVMNYLTSHDDGNPFDKNRTRTFEAGTKLLLTPGISQVYYGDESSRDLDISGAVGDATLRSKMNWDEIAKNVSMKNLLQHYQKIGQFRAKHPSIGAGLHQQITAKPYVFYRSYQKENYKDLVVVALELNKGDKTLKVAPIFKDGMALLDAYSNQKVTVQNGEVKLSSPFSIVLLEPVLK